MKNQFQKMNFFSFCVPGSLFFSGIVSGKEGQADEVGIRYMEKARYNPWGMAKLLGTPDKFSEGSRSTPETLQAHPLTDKRIKRVHEIIEKDYKDYSPDTRYPHTSRFMKMRSLLRSVVKA